MKHDIHPCLWFDGNAKEAAELYCSLFPDSGITVDTPMVVNFTIGGQKFMGLNGGPMFKPTPAISFFVTSESKAEVDHAWNTLSDGGQVLMPLDRYDWSEQYGWVQDRYGVNWQLAFGKIQDVGQKVAPSLMFTKDQAGKAKEAIEHYTSVFKPSSIVGIMNYAPGEPDDASYVKHAQFKLGSGVFMAMDSSLMHDFQFTEGVSLVVECDTQDEIDDYWNKLTEGGAESMCGWLKDKYGVSWQIIPANIGQLIMDPARGGKVMEAVMQMRKLDMATMQRAYESA